MCIIIICYLRYGIPFEICLLKKRWIWRLVLLIRQDGLYWKMMEWIQIWIWWRMGRLRRIWWQLLEVTGWKGRQRKLSLKTDIHKKLRGLTERWRKSTRKRLRWFPRRICGCMMHRICLFWNTGMIVFMRCRQVWNLWMLRQNLLPMKWI